MNICANCEHYIEVRDWYDRTSDRRCGLYSRVIEEQCLVTGEVFEIAKWVTCKDARSIFGGCGRAGRGYKEKSHAEQ